MGDTKCCEIESNRKTIQSTLSYQIVGKFVYKLNIIYRIDLCRNRNILSPCNPELVDLLDI